MQSTISSSPRPVVRRSRRIIAGRLTVWVLLIAGAAIVLSSVLAGGRSASSKSEREAGLVGNEPKEERLTRARSFNGDLRDLSLRKSAKWTWPEHEEQINPTASAATEGQSTQAQSVTVLTRQNAPDSASQFTTSPKSLSLGKNPIENFFNLAALNASVGTNTNPAGGLADYQGTGSISIDPNNSLHLIASSNTFYKDPTATCQSPTGGTANTYGTIALFGSTDGGATWTYNCAPWPTTVTGGVTGATYWFGSYPTLAWDNQGRAYATYMLISQSASAYGAAIVVARSSDNGASWQSLGTVVNGIASTTQGNDKEMMAIDNSSGQTFSRSGRLYVIWQAANAEKIAFSDDGTAWTTVNFPSNTGAGGGNVVVGADGTVYVIWSRYNVETIVFSKSTDGGATWTAPQVIATLALQSYGTNNKPPAQDKRGINGFGAIDVDRNPASAFFGNLYVSFTDFPSGTTSGADTNAYVIRSTNGGTSWSSRVKVNDDNFGATQMFPWLAVDQSDGTVNVSWYDTRLDPLNRKTQMVSSRSVDGGATFEPNVLVSDGGSAWRNNVNYSDENSTDNPAFNSNQYGDYSGLAALNRQVHPLWTDSRMFFPLADTQTPTRREDNATATITYCSAPLAIASPAVNSSTTPRVAVSWSAPGWGANATSGTYSVFRNTVAIFPSSSPLASDLTSTSYVDTTGNSGTTYYYFVRAKNNCPGTALTPMSTDSPASAGVDFGSAGTPTGTLQGTVSAGSSPVSGVVVTAGTLSATTNASGFYLFAAIDAATYAVSASPSGYNPVSVNGVVVTDGSTSTQNLAITPITSGSCLTDTTYVDFSPGAGSNVDIAGNPGDVKLRDLGVEATDQSSLPVALSTTNNLSATTWAGQTFRAGVTGNLTKISLNLGLASGTSGTITLEIRNLNGVNPGTTVLATTTVGPVTNVGNAVLYTTTFATPAAVVSGTSYSVVLKTSVGNTVFGVRGSTAGGSSLANGQVFTTTTSGATWNPVTADLYFTTYVTPPTNYSLSGNLSSGVKDANSVVGLVPRWLTLSWNATTPANTNVQFQAAASNSINGPFNFVGPDGTAATFFTTSGSSLSQFNGFRYLRYEALLSTSNNLITPTLSDITVCFNNDTPLITVSGPLSRQQAAGASNSQIATVSDPGQAANTLTVTAAPVTGTGVIVNNIVIDAAGMVTADVSANCSATNSTFKLTVTNTASTTATATLTVNVTAPDTPTITPGEPTTFCSGDSVTLTSSSATGNQWYLDGNPIGGATNPTYNATASGTYSEIVTTNGCASPPSAGVVVTVNLPPTTPTITPGGPTTFCAGNDVTLTSSGASGNQWYLNGNPIGGATNQTFSATATGDYSVKVTAGGCVSAPSSNTAVTANPNPAKPTITPGGPTTFCTGGSVTLTSSGASGNQWYLNGNLIGGATDQTYITTASGDYTDIVTTSGCASAPSTATTVTVNTIPATPTITPGGPTTFCEGGRVTLTSSSASGNQWYLNGNPMGGATNQSYVGTASGEYTLTVTASGCASGPSTATTLTVNSIPATPAITPGGPTTFCEGGSVTLTSSSASDNQWYLNGNPIGGATNQAYIATASGDYITTVATSGCSSSSAPTTVTVNTTPSKPLITAGGPTAFCEGGSVTLSTNSASGIQWYLDGNPISDAHSQNYSATASGNYTATLTALGCACAASDPISVTINPIPPPPTITPGGPTTFCEGGSVTLTSSTDSASGNQWYLNGNPIVGATNQTFNATASGNYTMTSTVRDCRNDPSVATTVTVNPIPPTPTITLSGPATFCEGGEVILTSSSASGNQWYRDGNPIGGATNQTFGAGAAGDYTVMITASGCTGAPSPATTVTADRPPTLSYSNRTVVFNGSLTIDPAAGPSDNGTVSSIVTQSSATYTGTITVNNTTGVVSISNAAPAGTHTVTIRATDNCSATTDTSFSLTVSKADQTITVGTTAPANSTYNTSFTVAATSNSGLAVTHSSAGICTNVGAVFKMTSGAGTCTVKYDQAGDGNYNAATQVTEAVTAEKASQSIIFGALTNKAFSDPDFSVSATTSANLPVTFSAGGSCTVTGSTVHITGPGSCTITASQAGDVNYNAATDAPQSFSTDKSNQTITFAALGNKTFGDADFAVGGTSDSNLALSFAASGQCTISSSRVHIMGPGSCTITASQAGDGNYNAAMDVLQSFSTDKSNQTITFAALEDKTFGDADFAVSGTSDSNLALSFAASGQCTLSGLMLHIAGSGSCTITASQSGDGSYNPAPDVAQSFMIGNTALITLSQSNYNVSESTGLVTITVNRTGDLSIPVTVDYATDDTGASSVCGTVNSGMASALCDLSLTLGTLEFAATESQQSFVIPITQDSFTEGPEIFTVILSNLSGTAGFATPSNATVTISDSFAPAPNAINDTETFVRQQYRDFLNREADPAGLAFWTNEIDSCGSDAGCREIKRINVSAAFFLSIEFQTTGNLVRSFYVVALNRPATNNMPALVEFLRDTQAMLRGVVVGEGKWQQTLNDNRDAFMRDFVSRTEFVGLYPTTDTPAQYVDKLYLHAGITPTVSERSDAIIEFGRATTAADAGARGRALLHMTRHAGFQQREMNRSFVQMEYFGYLRRNPNEAPDGNFDGYDFWVNKLNAMGGNYIASEMVKGFISSGEYRRRFGP